MRIRVLEIKYPEPPDELVIELPDDLAGDEDAINQAIQEKVFELNGILPDSWTYEDARDKEEAGG